MLVVMSARSRMVWLGSVEAKSPRDVQQALSEQRTRTQTDVGNGSHFLPPLRYRHRGRCGEEQTGADNNAALLQLLHSRSIRVRLVRNQRRQTLPEIRPLSSQGGVYDNGDGGPSSHPQGGFQEGVWDPRAPGQLQSLKELDLQGRDTRAGSRHGRGGRRDRGAVSRSAQDDTSGLVPPVTGSKATLRANGFRKDLLNSASSHARNGHGVAGPEEDLVAMGTLFSPKNQHQHQSTQTSTSTSSLKSLPGSGINSCTQVSGSLTPAPRQFGSSSSALQLAGAPLAMGNVVKSKGAAPKYSDPVPGAPAAFQQRLMELEALEAETVRLERSRKVKKKPFRQDKET